jgi:hypothetical protein
LGSAAWPPQDHSVLFPSEIASTGWAAEAQDVADLAINNDNMPLGVTSIRAAKSLYSADQFPGFHSWAFFVFLRRWSSR